MAVTSQDRVDTTGACKGYEEMDDKDSGNGLLLPDLHIENFRGIKKLSIPRLGRVTLLAGRNGVGKSTVLDAIRVYSARGRYAVLGIMLETREELLAFVNKNYEDAVEPDWTALFYGRDISEDICVSIGPRNDADRLTIAVTSLNNEQTFLVERMTPYSILSGRIRAFTVKYKGLGYTIPLEIPNDGWGYPEIGNSSRNSILSASVDIGESSRDRDLPSPIKCFAVGPGLLDYIALSTYWKNVALTDDERHVVRSLRMIYGADVERVSVVGTDAPSHRRDGRRAIVKLKSHDRPVPLRSLGDGAMRLFGVALALANSRNGFLLIDEAENGIHHSVQRDFWRMVLQTAHENNVQIFATTHSWDCVRGFAWAAAEDEKADGVLVRLERQKKDSGLRAVRYTKDDLKIAADQVIEVR